MVTVASESVQLAHQILSRARRCHCICHRGPDGDAVGSLFGIALLLQQAYPRLHVAPHCFDAVPQTFAFLPFYGCVQKELMIEAGDCALFVDCAVPKQTGYHESHPALFNGSLPSINIDHHPDSSFADVNLVDSTASSTCEIIAEISRIQQWSLSPDIATCLLTGLYTDTGGLLHSNVTAAVYRTVGHLLRCGARQPEVVQHVFRTSRLSTLRLWGRVLEKISLSAEGGAVSAATAGDFRAAGADYSELTGAIDYVNAIPGLRFSLILSERDGKVKGSLRTLRDDVDVAAMASTFQGGGHKKAAGFSVDGSLQPEVRWKVVRQE